MRLSVDDFIALLSGSIAAWLERQTAARIEYLKAEIVRCEADLLVGVSFSRMLSVGPWQP